MTQQNTNNDAGLAELGEPELRAAMHSRLQGNPTIGPLVDSRIGPEPFEWLSEQFRRGDAGLQHRMTAVLGDFLDELPDTDRWPERARYALLDLIQDCGESLIDHLHRLIRQQTFLKAAGLGPEVHAALLKCLISNGHHATPDFWLAQFNVLGPEYGALIFSGLVDHGLNLAMSHLPRLCVDAEAKNLVRWLFPHLQDKFGAGVVLEQLEQIRDQLPEDTYLLYRGDLLPTVAPDVSPTLQGLPAEQVSCPPDGTDCEPIEPVAAQSERQPPLWLVETIGHARTVRPESPRPFAGLFTVEAA